jgi:hypothetical protein
LDNSPPHPIKEFAVRSRAVMPKQRFPVRTIILMVLALLAFGHLYWRTHQTAEPAPAPPPPPPVAPKPTNEIVPVEIVHLDGGG